MFYETTVLDSYGKLKKVVSAEELQSRHWKLFESMEGNGSFSRKMSLRTERRTILKKHPLKTWVRMIINSRYFVPKTSWKRKSPATSCRKFNFISFSKNLLQHFQRIVKHYFIFRMSWMKRLLAHTTCGLEWRVFISTGRQRENVEPTPSSLSAWMLPPITRLSRWQIASIKASPPNPLDKFSSACV